MLAFVRDSGYNFGRRRFTVVTLNSLPDSLRDTELSLDTFARYIDDQIVLSPL